MALCGIKYFIFCHLHPIGTKVICSVPLTFPAGISPAEGRGGKTLLSWRIRKLTLNSFFISKLVMLEQVAQYQKAELVSFSMLLFLLISHVSVSDKTEQRPSASSATLEPSQPFLPKLAASKELQLPSVISGLCWAASGQELSEIMWQICIRQWKATPKHHMHEDTKYLPCSHPWESQNLIGILGLRIQDPFLLSNGFSVAQSYWLENATRYTQVSLNKEVFFTSQFLRAISLSN